MAGIRWLVLLVPLAYLCACSSSNEDVPAFDAVSGKHPSGWVEQHWMEFVNDPDECRECHGQDLAGGISRLSCFTASIGMQTCHATGPAGHPFDWNRPDLHGAAAKRAPGGSMSGFASCQRCHGGDLAGGTAAVGGSAPVSCFSCHTGAPHADSPWRGTIDVNITHTSTDEGNAPVCALCHLNNQRLTTPASVPAGVTIGCFNNTLCHGVSGHPAGWGDPSQHGAAAKTLPGSTTGFSYCQKCHGSAYQGVGAAVSCFDCHPAPHASAPWRASAGSVFTHTDTNTANAAACALCHLGSRTPPSPVPLPAGTVPECFNGSLCHTDAAAAPHAAGPTFRAANLHGPEAKKDLVFCKGCHGTAGGAGSNPEFNVILGGSDRNSCQSANCHQVARAHPRPASGFTFWIGHPTAENQQNACSLCHGAGLAGGIGRACTACHTQGSPLTLKNCSSCHGNPPPPPAETNFTHREHNTLAPNITGKCQTCHTNAGSGTASHFNGFRNVLIAAAFNAKSGEASYGSTATTCANVSCHGGITTPAWKTGFINVNTECSRCHVGGTAQFNGFFSGRHFEEAHVNRGCTSCHDTTRLATSHFVGLDTPAFTNPRGTLRTAINYNGATCNPSAGGLSGCHSQESW